mmetsp:Transcript_109225/g.348510  ORF Transcript_109225/g.348510 Transcript_109225/m.348510 type:complete len:371 (-) Transcript_109225:1062-2174(-)
MYDLARGRSLHLCHALAELQSQRRPLGRLPLRVGVDGRLGAGPGGPVAVHGAAELRRHAPRGRPGAPRHSPALPPHGDLEGEGRGPGRPGGARELLGGVPGQLPARGRPRPHALRAARPPSGARAARGVGGAVGRGPVGGVLQLQVEVEPPRHRALPPPHEEGRRPARVRRARLPRDPAGAAARGGGAPRAGGARAPGGVRRRHVGPPGDDRPGHRSRLDERGGRRGHGRGRRSGGDGRGGPAGGTAQGGRRGGRRAGRGCDGGGGLLPRARRLRRGHRRRGQGLRRRRRRREPAAPDGGRLRGCGGHVRPPGALRPAAPAVGAALPRADRGRPGHRLQRRGAADPALLRLHLQRDQRDAQPARAGVGAA